jgi:NADPH:quinone reductase-like Zn-dependent oxidoreductase
MRAIVQDVYGAPGKLAKLREIPDPVPGDHDVLVRVRAASVNPADWHLMRGDPWVARLVFGLRRPKDTVAGCDLAGEVEAVGRAVTRLKVGDAVFGCSFMVGFGAFAERAAVPEDRLVPKPAALSFEAAAAMPVAGMTALQGVRDHGRVQAGERVLVIGASGGVGTFAVQIAKALGAEVTGVCSTANVDLVRSLGADHVIDRTAEDPLDGAQRYDVVLQLAGTSTAADCRRALTPKGTLVIIGGDSSGRLIGAISRTLVARASAPFVSQRIANFTVSPNVADLAELARLAEAGQLQPAVSRRNPLAEVPEALEHLEQGHARGKVVITL